MTSTQIVYISWSSDTCNFIINICVINPFEIWLANDTYHILFKYFFMSSSTSMLVVSDSCLHALGSTYLTPPPLYKGFSWILSLFLLQWLHSTVAKTPIAASTTTIGTPYVTIVSLFLFLLDFRDVNFTIVHLKWEWH